MGTKGKYDLTAVLIAKRHLQLRDNSIEAARIVATKFLEKTLGTEFFFKILIYPHQIIREKPIAMGAGADRFSQGMRQSFGKPVGNAAQVKIGQRLMIVSVNKKNIEVAKLALKKVGYKISTTTRIVVEQAQS
jgi:large subunit ribosomal protein L10e